MTGTFDDDLGRMLAGRVIDAASVMGGGGYRVLYEQVTLSLDTLTTVWHKENLGSLHNVLVDVAYWLDEDDQRNALREASGELAQQKLLAGNGLDPNFRAVLDVLARPSVEFYGWIASRNEDDTHTNLAVLVAATGPANAGSPLRRPAGNCWCPSCRRCVAG